MAKANDRKTTLVLVGILDILIGLFMLLLGIAVLLAPLLAKNQSASAPAHSGAIFIFYLALAALAAWLGIGLILARRWARALGLIGGWLGLVIGVVAFAVVAYLLPAMLENMQKTQPNAAGAMGVVQVTVYVVLFIGYILIPGLQVLGLQPQSVKDTCDRRNPVESWTDCCALPVLAMALLWVLGAAVIAIMPFVYGMVFPAFGVILEGVPALLVMLAIAALNAWIAWQAYHLKMTGWWVALGWHLIWGVSTAVTFSRIDLMDLYQKMNFSAEQLKPMAPLVGSFGKSLAWYLAGFLAVYLGFWVYCRKYFLEGNKEG